MNEVQLTDKAWQERYSITSIKGKVWTRTELLNRAVRIAAMLLPEQPRSVIRTAVHLVLDDPEFMRRHAGMVPARVIEDSAMEAFLRIRRRETKP